MKSTMIVAMAMLAGCTDGASSPGVDCTAHEVDAQALDTAVDGGTLLAPDGGAPARSFFIVGDSFMATGDEVGQSMPLLVTGALWPARVTLDVATTLHAIASDVGRAKNYVSMVTRHAPTDVYIQVGIYDWQRLDWDAAEYKAGLADLVGRIATLNPAVTVWLQTIAGSAHEGQANANGETPEDYRASTREVFSACATCVLIEGLDLMPVVVPAIFDATGVNPAAPARVYYAEHLKAAVNPGGFWP